MNRRTATVAERKRMEAERRVRRQLTLGVLCSIQAVSFGAVPRPRSYWPALASVAGWGLAALITLGILALAAAQ